MINEFSTSHIHHWELVLETQPQHSSSVVAREPFHQEMLAQTENIPHQNKPPYIPLYS